MDIQEQFREWFKPQKPESYKNWDFKLDEIKEAYFASFNRNVFDVDLDNIDLSIHNILSDLKERKNVTDTTFADYNKRSSNGIPQAILRTWLIPFLKNYSRNKSGINIENKYTEKTKIKEQPYEIVQCAMGKIIEINQNLKNHKKDSIFKQKVHELSRIIERPCVSEGQFIKFTLNLYIMIYETTREETSHNTKGKPFYDYKLPDEFIKNGTTTRLFMDIVGTLRHHYAHLEPEYKESIRKMSYGDVLNELLGSRDEPESREDFQKLQIEVLKRFEGAMKDLYRIVNEKLNPPKTH